MPVEQRKSYRAETACGADDYYNHFPSFFFIFIVLLSKSSWQYDAMKQYVWAQNEKLSRYERVNLPQKKMDLF